MPQSDLVSGTITLTNGSISFTGAGTSFALSQVREGDEFKQIAGQTQWDAMVATITSNTAGTLVRPWGGATGTYAYRLRFQADGSRVTAAARNLIELLGNGNLQAEAGINGTGGNLLSYFTGAGSKAVTAITAKGRALLAKTSASDMQTELGISAFMKTLLDDADATTARTSIGAQVAGSYLTDVPVNLTPDKAFRRGNILGGASQASGVPTGALFEKGSNTNGIYHKYADGLLVCGLNNLSIPGSGPGYRNGLWTYPAAFVSPPTVTGIARTFGDAGIYQGGNGATGPTTTSVSFILNVVAGGAGTLDIQLQAIGRWF